MNHKKKTKTQQKMTMRETKVSMSQMIQIMQTMMTKTKYELRLNNLFNFKPDSTKTIFWNSAKKNSHFNVNKFGLTRTILDHHGLRKITGTSNILKKK